MRKQCPLDTAVVIAYTRLMQAQTPQNPRMERGVRHTISSLAVEVLAIISCLKKNSQLSAIGQPFISQSCFNQIPHFQQYWAAQIGFVDLKNNITQGMMGLGTFGRGGKQIKILWKIVKGLIKIFFKKMNWKTFADAKHKLPMFEKLEMLI